MYKPATYLSSHLFSYLSIRPTSYRMSYQGATGDWLSWGSSITESCSHPVDDGVLVGAGSLVAVPLTQTGWKKIMWFQNTNLTQKGFFGRKLIWIQIMKFDTMGLEENNMNLKIQNLRLFGGRGFGKKIIWIRNTKFDTIGFWKK